MIDWERVEDGQATVERLIVEGKGDDNEDGEVRRQMEDRVWERRERRGRSQW